MKKTFEAAVRDYQAGRYESALGLATRALAKARDENPAVLALIGNINFKMGNRLEAAEAFERAAKKADGKIAPGFLKLAVTLFQGVGLTDRILEIGVRAVALNPSDSDLAFTVASAFFSHGRWLEMDPLLERLDRKNDRHLALIVNHHRLMGRFDELYAELEQGVKANPDDWFLNVSRFAVAREVLDFDTMARYEALMKAPDAPFAAGLLSREQALGRILWSEDEALNASACQEVAGYAATRPAEGRSKRRPFSAAGERIRIGYLSNDFHRHATMTLFLEAMACHDRKHFDVVLLCYTEKNAAAQQADWPEHLRQAVVPIGHLSDSEAADRIGELGVDILVDLKGHTMGARLNIVNLADAPVKVTYLGFPGSVTGVDLDYVISDPVVTPDTSKPFYAEKLCRLPETYQANSWKSRPLPEFVERADAGLPEDAFVFGSFNATYKITPRTLALWADVLKAVPDSVFWILCPAPAAQRNLLSAFEDRGIPRSRIIFADRKPYPAHVSRLPLADLGLDTFPYNGHTTTSDMLWAGLPVLTTRGKAFAARVSASLLGAAGLPELVAETDREFVDKATMLARDPYALSALRQRLEADRFVSPLFDCERFTRHLEHGFELMAERARAGLAPDHIDVPAAPRRTAPFHVA